MPLSVQRTALRFPSGGDECAAWHYAGSTGVCVVMGSGFGVAKEPGTDVFARRFHDDGFSVLAFDHRGFGDSGGHPRQVVRIREQLRDWENALAAATRLPEVDPARIAAWGFSSGGGHVLRIAARTPWLGAAVAQTPTADGQAAALNAARYQTGGALLRLFGRGLLDTLGSAVGREPLLVPLAAEKGTVALLTTPDSRDGDRALDPDGLHAGWVRAVAARSALGPGFYRPGRDAHQVRCPLLVVVGDEDRSALAAPAVAAAGRAPRGEVVRLPGGHYAPFLESHETAVAAELAFLRRHLVPRAADRR